MTHNVGWNDPETARRYEAFYVRHARYRRANEELARVVPVEAGMCVVDLGAGTGRTAEAIAARLERGRLVCVEPSAAMRAVGQARLAAHAETQVEWRTDLPDAPADLVVSGAAVWQIEDPAALVRRLARMLGPRGALAFTIPALYLGVPDRPGGGVDPLLFAIPAYLARHAPPPTAAPPATLRTEEDWRALLEAAGFSVEVHAFEHVMTQEELRDWLAIPVLTNHLLGALDLPARDRLLDEALAASDRASFRLEGWRVFVARKQP